MTGCSAVGCTNSSTKGFLMKRFPKDPSRRKQWTIKMRRDNWKPSDHCYLCEVHFAPEMWEKTRVDGTRKLKPNAVPTVFCFSKQGVKRKPPTVRKKDSPVKANILEAEVEFTQTYSEMLSDQPSTSSQVIQNTPSTTSSSSDEVPENLEVMATLDRYKILYNKAKQRIRCYKNRLRSTKRRFRTVDENVLLKTIFNKDQINALDKKNKRISTKFMTWSKQTVTKALKLKFSCGSTGYEELLKQGYPLPSNRTLQRRLQNLKFDCGVLDEVFDFLKIKCEMMKPHERDCALVLDEASITPGQTYDSSLHKFYGDVTLPEHDGIANHVLVFMLAGVNSRWKQIVAYYFTGSSVNGRVFVGIINNIIYKAEELKLNVLSVTSDMGPSNKALWKTLGIMAGKYCTLKCSIEHPLHADGKIYFFADVPHLFKNIKNMLVVNKVILLSVETCEKYSREVLINHIFELVKYQEKCCFKLAPKLSEEDLMPSHFDKMKVSTSTNVINHSVVSALRFIADLENKKEYLTTAWFLDQVERWFYLMTSRHASSAISKFNLEIYDNTINFLKDFMHFFSQMEVGVKKIWKPTQTGVLISTQSILDLQKYLLEEKRYEFILTSRFSQDCLENLFSVLRSKQIVPNAMQVKNNLKLISVSQYLKESTHGSYDDDERQFLSGFLDTIQEKKTDYSEVSLPDNLSFLGLNLNYSEMNSLYNIAGYLVHSIKRTSKTCNICLDSVASKTPIYKNFSKFVNIKSFKINTLFFCTELVFYFFVDMETVFQQYISAVSGQNINLKDFFFNKMILLDVDIPECHHLKQKIVKRFVIFRLKIYSKKHKNDDKYGSKSVAGHRL